MKDEEQERLFFKGKEMQILEEYNNISKQISEGKKKKEEVLEKPG